jgi:hypothetical protein
MLVFKDTMGWIEDFSQLEEVTLKFWIEGSLEFSNHPSFVGIFIIFSKKFALLYIKETKEILD